MNNHDQVKVNMLKFMPVHNTDVINLLYNLHMLLWFILSEEVTENQFKSLEKT
jgi:hypothetical protein